MFDLLFNRKKTPVTAEELMVSEYLEKSKELQDTHEKLQNTELLLDVANEKSAELEAQLKTQAENYEKRISDIVCDQSGIVDTNNPTLVRKFSIGYASRFKNLVENDSIEDGIKELQRLLRMTDSRLIEYCLTVQLDYGYLVRYEERMIHYVLSVPHVSGRIIKYYDPDISTSSFIRVEEAMIDEWSLGTKESLMVTTAFKLRDNIKKAIKELQEENKDAN